MCSLANWTLNTVNKIGNIYQLRVAQTLWSRIRELPGSISASALLVVAEVFHGIPQFLQKISKYVVTAFIQVLSNQLSNHFCYRMGDTGSFIDWTQRNGISDIRILIEYTENPECRVFCVFCFAKILCYTLFFLPLSLPPFIVGYTSSASSIYTSYGIMYLQ